MVRLLREPRVLATVAAALAACTLFVALGRWQWHRHEGKVAVRDLVRANYSAAALDLDRLLPAPPGDLAPQREWRPAQVTGTYDPAHTVLARDRILDGDNGYEVLVPLRTAHGVLLVDRGWIPAGRTARGPAEVPAPPDGTVTLTVRLRPWQAPSSRVTPPGQTGRISRSAVSAATGIPSSRLYGAYGVLAVESRAAPTPITLLERPDTDLGPHLAYAVQWWGFALVLLVLLARAGDKEARRRALEASPSAPTRGRAATPPHTPAPRRTGKGRWARITASGGTVDEEAEEAEIARFGHDPGDGTRADESPVTRSGAGNPQGEGHDARQHGRT